MKHMKISGFKSVVWKEGKQYVAQCLNVDISSFGKTKKEALANLNEALELYFEDAKPREHITKVIKPELVEFSISRA